MATNSNSLSSLQSNSMATVALVFMSNGSASKILNSNISVYNHNLCALLPFLHLSSSKCNPISQWSQKSRLNLAANESLSIPRVISSFYCLNLNLSFSASDRSVLPPHLAPKSPIPDQHYNLKSECCYSSGMFVFGCAFVAAWKYLTCLSLLFLLSISLCSCSKSFSSCSLPALTRSWRRILEVLVSFSFPDLTLSRFSSYLLISHHSPLWSIFLSCPLNCSASCVHSSWLVVNHRQGFNYYFFSDNAKTPFSSPDLPPELQNPILHLVLGCSTVISDSAYQKGNDDYLPTPSLFLLYFFSSIERRKFLVLFSLLFSHLPSMLPSTSL